LSSCSAKVAFNDISVDEEALVFNPWRGLKNLPGRVWIVFVTTLVNRAGTMVLPFLVLYLTQELGYTVGQAGFALTVYGLGGLISAPLAGRLSDRVGAVRVMQVSLLVSGVLLLILPYVRSTPQLFALVLLWSAIGEAVRPASLVAVSEATTAEQRKAAVALNRLAINLGMSVGPAAGGFLAAVSFQVLFVIDGATSIAAGLVLTGLVGRAIQRDSGESRSAPPGRASALGALRNRPMLTFMVAVLLVGTTFFQMEAALPLFLVRDLGMTTAFFGLLTTLNTLLIIFIEVPLNLAMAHWPHRAALVLGALLVAAGFGALAFVAGPVGAALTVVIWTFGEMILFPAAATYVSELAPPDRQGEYMGAYWVALSLAMTLGPWAGTLYMDRFGAPALWIAAFLCAACSAAIFCWGSVANQGAAREIATPALQAPVGSNASSYKGGR
jgi:predicted MFS family arabinose efflux permease